MPKVPKSKTPGFDRSKYHVDRTRRGGVQVTLKGGSVDRASKNTQERLRAQHPGFDPSAGASRRGITHALTSNRNNRSATGALNHLKSDKARPQRKK